ncbi:MAG: aminotransferase class I/II-fold pyridoxal phosphate-dependent enzyme [Clostridia bacterium]|nr:aminotransferase class I/II-fold pyridoxal phosphate-dependent enzyme [Clostridia bacterium]
MKYDFTTIMDRHGHDAIAVDNPPQQPKDGFDLIPMGVADMNFATAPSILAAIRGRLEHPAFGYFNPRDEYFDAIIRWQSERNGVTALDRSAISFHNGVLGSVASALNAMQPHDRKVLIHAPTYTGFIGVLENAGFELIYTQLQKDENGVWRIDPADMEAKILEHGLTAAVFCSPHNPSGRVWEKWEIEQAMSIYEKYNMDVVSDEIWSDLVLCGHKHIPTQSVSEYARTHTAAMYAPTKTFNLAGITGSYSIIYNEDLRARVVRQTGLSHYSNMNVLSMYALIGAYSPEGAEWCDELREVLTGNVKFACAYIREHFKGVSVSEAEGTYMLFPDCSEWCAAHGKTLDDILHAAWDKGIAFIDGRPFHGPCHLRINVALPRARVEEAFARMDKYVFNAE